MFSKSLSLLCALCLAAIPSMSAAEGLDGRSQDGIKRDGIFTGPFMQSPHLSDEDLISIIAFLRSDDPLTAPRDIDDRQMKVTFLTKLLLHVAWKPLPVLFNWSLAVSRTQRQKILSLSTLLENRPWETTWWSSPGARTGMSWRSPRT